MYLNSEAKIWDRLVFRWMGCKSALLSLWRVLIEKVQEVPGKINLSPVWNWGGVCHAAACVVSTRRKTEVVVAPFWRPAKPLSRQSRVSRVCWAAANDPLMGHSLCLLACIWAQTPNALVIPFDWVNLVLLCPSRERNAFLRFLPGTMGYNARGGARTWGQRKAL